ncbi:hypothetical protein [Desulfonema magnum]|uniref:Uncharacterized protein n=1 Tax=Desulfonema magnum TaxID=45655 RepID=A0A975GT94_9BACT|nr:hypothetical protein [Desulfonema magnum]QTA92846.1 Uncharacterized protein dnm_089390 [Desulfonema magnum]
MKKKSVSKVVFDDHVGCFGDFSINDPVCKKYCALSLRCTIASDQNDQLEFFEDMIYPDDMFMRFH